MDKEWICGATRTERQMIIEADELCTYSVLYYNQPDSVIIKLVRDLELTIEKGIASKTDNSAEIDPLIEDLRGQKVLIMWHCSPT
jgi:hypothetical protein